MMIDRSAYRTWVKSSKSDGQGNCVEVSSDVAAMVAVRDSKDPSGPILVFSREAFAEFVDGIRRGEFDLNR